MKKSLLILAVSALLAMPCILRAEEVEIQLMEVIQMSPLPGDDPLDGNDHMEPNPTRPNDFRATINGNALTITTQNTDIQSAQAVVVDATTGGVVVNELFSTDLQEQIALSGTYILHIETDGGALVGQFVVQ